MTGHPNPNKWTPTTATRIHQRPTPGQVIGWRYGAWRVRDTTPVHDSQLTDDQRATMAIYRHPYREHHRPYHLVLAHLAGPRLVDPQHLQRLHDGTTTVHLGVNNPARVTWHLLDDHYAICVCHGDPHPCGDLQAARLAAQAATRLDRLLTRHQPSTCYACGEPVTTRAARVTFPEPSPLLPGAIGPTFHTGRALCWSEARRFELTHRLRNNPHAPRLVSCPGVLFVHLGDRRHDCTAELLCTGHHGPNRTRGWPLTATGCTTRTQLYANDGAYPRPPGVCTEPDCLGRDTSTGAPDPTTVGDHDLPNPFTL